MNTKFTPEEILNSLDGMQKAAPSPFLYTRIQGRMTKEGNSQLMTFFRYVTNPAFSLSVAFLFILINGYFLTINIDQEISLEDNSQIIAAEYVQQPLNPYETTTETP
jgi:hypothetical protein